MRRGVRYQAKQPASGPLVSIITTSYNHEKYIGQTIQSVLSQTYANWELIVSDDCSTDNSLEIIRAFSDDRITVLTNDTNTGCRHVTQAYALAKGKYVCSLDSDDFIAPDKIEKQVRFLEEHPNVDALGTFVVEVNADGNATGDRNGHEAWFNQDIDLNQVESWVWQNRLAHSSVLMRKSLYDKIGPGNYDLFMTGDYEYWAKCLIQKAVFHVLPEKLTYYRYHGDNVSHSDAERLFLESAYIFSSILSPYLIEVGRADLVIDGIFEPPADSFDQQLWQTVKSYLLTSIMRDHQTIGLPKFLEAVKGHQVRQVALASALVDKFKKQSHWVSELEKAKSWLDEQRTKWQIEAEREAQYIKDQTATIQELEQASSQLADQRTKWQIQAERDAQLVNEQSASIRELEQAKSWLEDQRAKWQSEAEREAQLLEKQKERVRELEQARSVLEEHQAKRHAEVSRRSQLLEEQSKRIWDLQQNQSLLQEQLANKTQEIQAASRMLSEVKESSLSHLELKGRIIEDQESVIKARNIELASRCRELALKEKELIAIKYSKLQRLKHSILHDPLSLRKLVRITYLATALATPKPLRQRLKSVEQRLRGVFVDDPQNADSNLRLVPWRPGNPLVSVIIPCFNYGSYVEEAVDSVLAQTFQHFEIIVIDAGSTDGTTVSTLRSLRKPKTRIHFRKGGRHLVGDNRNFGISMARGKYICCLDADDKLKPTYLEKALFLLETGQYDLISTSLEVFGGTAEGWNVPRNPTLEGLLQENQFTTVAVFRKEFWEMARGYHDTGLGEAHIYEDWDFWVRLMALGARATNIAAEPLMLYRMAGGMSLSKHPEIRPMDAQKRAIVAHNQNYLHPEAFENSRERNNLKFEGGSYANLLDEHRLSKDRKRVLLALPFVITGGADTVVLPIAKNLAAHGFDISVLTTIRADPSFGDNTSRYQAITPEIYHLYNFLDDETAWKEFVFYLIEARAIDIIFIVGCAFLYHLLPEIKQKFPHVKVFDQLFNEFGHLPTNRQYASLIDFNFAANETVSSVLIKQYGETPDKVRFIPHGVDAEEEFNPKNINTSDVVAAGQIPADKLIISFIGRFSEEKRPEMFVDIANALRGLEQLHFVMLGHGPDYDRVRQQIAELGLENRFYAPGVVEVKPFLKLTDVLVIPSKIEGIPLVLMEALALGVPVVASDVGGIPSVLKNNETGFVCDRDRIEDFIQCIDRICADASLRERLKQNARPYALEHLSLKKNTVEYLKVFQQFSPQQPKSSRVKNPLRRLISFNFSQDVRQTGQ